MKHTHTHTLLMDRKNIPCNHYSKQKSDLAILIPNKLDFKIRYFKWENQGNIFNDKEILHQDNIIILNVYVSNNKALM